MVLDSWLTHNDKIPSPIFHLTFSKSYSIFNIKTVSSTVDGLVKSRKRPFFVIPVKTGIQVFQLVTNHLDSGACPGPDPGFTGVTTFYRGITVYTGE